jgi:hypothetical protein
LKTVLETAASCVAATASCYLGLLAASLVGSLPTLLTLLRPGTRLDWVRLQRLTPAFGVSATDDPSLTQLLFQDALPLFVACCVVVGGPLLCGRFYRWGRLFCAFAVLWAAVFLAPTAIAPAIGGRSSLTRILRFFALADFGEPVFGIVLAVTITLIVLGSLSRVVSLIHIDGTTGRWGRFGWGLALFVIPVALINWYQVGARFGPSYLLLLGPTWIAVLALLGSLWRPRPTSAPLQLSRVGGAVVLCLALSSYAGANYFSRIEAQPKKEAYFDEHQSRHWDLRFERGYFTPEERTDWADAADERLENLADKIGVSLQNSRRLLAYVHVTTDSKRALAPERRTDSPYVIRDRPYLTDVPTDALHHLLAVDRSLRDPRGEALLLLRDVKGESGSDAAAGSIARYMAEQYLDQDLDAYARRVACEEEPYTLRQILGLDEEHLSPVVRDTMGGAWVASLMDRASDSQRQRVDGDVLQAIYATPLASGDEETFARALDSTWPELEAAWQEHLAGKPCSSSRTAKAPTYRGHEGITFTHEFRNDWGYGSDMAGRQLQRIHDLGASAIALVPYAGLRPPPSTNIRFRMSESDERIVRSIDQAHAAGLQVMLKPQLWGRIFTGDLRFERAEDFEVWFARYRRWILHHARLAELHGVELFCIGNELNGVTVHEKHWRKLIRDVRRIYSGPLTFAANWNEEFERITFWDELDYLGVNFYFPLAKRGERPRPNSPHLRELTKRLEAMHRRYGKPILFTEVGFPPLASAAAEPWEETNAAFDHALQEQCYETVFQAFSEKRWFAGMYWWKWPSHGQSSAFSIGHSPIGKPALEVLRSWYGKP